MHEESAAAHRRAYFASAPRRRLSRADNFFSQLDGQRIGAGPDSWVVTVYGVHVQHNQVWMQVGPSYDPECSLLLRLPASCTPHHALAALEAWLQQPTEDRAGVIDVMRVA